VQIVFVYPKLPPTIDGIGDHTVHLAAALANQGHDMLVLTAQKQWDTIPPVDIQHAFSIDTRRGVLDLVSAVETASPEWLVIQFEQFAYGRWGLNPYLPLALHRIRGACPATRCAVMFHEDFMPATSLKKAAMSAWQRAQFWMLGRLADTAFFSVESWADRYTTWFPNTPTHHLPVGSNIPRLDVPSADARRQLGIDAEAFVIGLFGSAHPARLLSFVDRAAIACSQFASNLQVLYVGPHEERVRSQLSPQLDICATGALPAEDVSLCFSAMDLYLAPFKRGVSTRRGSFMVGLQHGVATVSTIGPDTGTLLTSHRDDAFLLAREDHPAQFAVHACHLTKEISDRQRLAQQGQSFYQKMFSWPAIASRLQAALSHKTLATSSHTM
jgi:glycosyltransferase involved in cell wall biosynthesis